MFELAIYLAIAAILLLIGYVVSVLSNAVYIDPEEIGTIFPELSEGRKRQLEKFTSDPRAIFQVAFLVRITSAIGLGILAEISAQQITKLGILPVPTVYIMAFALFWGAAITMFVFLPRRIPHQKARRRLIRFLPLINLIHRLSSPAATVMKKISSPRETKEIPEDQKDDIVERAIETLAESAGIATPIIEEDEKEMIHQIFQLDVTKVEEIMIPRVNIIAFEENTGLDTIRETTKQYGYSRYPVYHETIDNILGILKVKDLLQLRERQQEDFKLTDHVREPVRVGKHRKIDQLLAEFKRAKTHMAIVLDEFGGTAGLVTLEDILEEIVGDIHDEDDTGEEPDIIRLDDGNLEVTGSCPLEDLVEKLGFELEQEEFETVGGLIYDLVGSVPIEGTTLSWKNRKIKVLKVDGQRIKKVLVIPIT